MVRACEEGRGAFAAPVAVAKIDPRAAPGEIRPITPAFWLVAVFGLLAVPTALTLLWLVSLRLRDASIVDPFWGPGFALVALAAGPLVGMRTWGGLVDGGSVTAEGVPPDIEVWMDARSVADGRDPQLERAVGETLRLLDAQGVTDPVAPPPFSRPSQRPGAR
jgi:hypothetical protein